MKKTIIIIAILLGVLTTVGAQSYSSLWKKANAAVEADKPKTAIPLLRQIAAKAEKEGSYGNMFSAVLWEVQQQAELSDDSLNVALKRLQATEAKLYEQKDDVRKRVADCVLRTVLYMNADKLTDESMHDKVVAMYPNVDSLLKSEDASIYTRANGTADYIPLVIREKGSQYFNNDLISLIGLETDQLKTLQAYYLSQGNEKAAAILEARQYYSRSFKTLAARVEYVDSMLGHWGAWEGINSLKREKESLTQPMLEMSLQSSLCRTFEGIKLCFRNVRNVKTAKVTITPKRGAQKTYDKMFVLPNDYETISDTLNIGTLPLGEYSISVTTERKGMKTEKEKLYVSDLHVISLPLPNDKVRYIVVDAKSGKPKANAKLHFIDKSAETPKETIRQTDENGELTTDTQKRGVEISASTDADNAMPSAYMSGRFSYYGSQKERKLCNIYTDRKVYRPGQEIKVAVLAYQVTDGKETAVRPNTEVTLRLIDAKYKKVEEKKVKTDEWGMANAVFQLNEGCITGTYNIRTGEGSVSLTIEEYVRPTFDVTIEKPLTAYHQGDTVVAKGRATTYSGIPVAGARVAYSVVSKTAFWWRPVYWGSKTSNTTRPVEELYNDTITTRADGSFDLKMPMVLGKSDNDFLPRFVNIVATATVTDMAGESHSAECVLPIGNHETCMTTNLSEKYLADSVKVYTVSRYNAAGQSIAGSVAVSIDGKAPFQIEANKQYELPKDLASGKHTFEAICEGDTVKCAFVMFRLTDERPVVETHDWWYVSETSFPENDGEVTIQYGVSDKDAYAVYTIFSGNKILESGHVKMDSSLVNLRLKYKPEYGDGITYTAAWVRDGKTYSHTADIRRYLPSKKLNVEWMTFRDKVTPGSKEEWTLKVTTPDGKASKSHVCATVFDKSLDAFRMQRWDIVDDRHIPTPLVTWRTGHYYGFSLCSYDDSFMHDYTDLSFTRFNEKYMPSFIVRSGYKEIRIRGNGKLARKSAMVFDAAEAVASLASPSRAVAYAKVANIEENDGAVMNATIGGLDDAETSEENGAQVSMRENFDETAAFLPNIVTDEEGQALISFTLPESVTTWRFIGLAHDKDMKFGTLESTCVAQKKLMVQPRMPRFLRETDKATISATVSNLYDEDLKAEAVLEILDHKTEKSRARIINNVEVKAGETSVVTFNVNAADLGEGMFITRISVRTKAKGKSGINASDGEQHLLPVLSNKVDVENTRPLVISEKGTLEVNVADMLPEDVKEGQMTVDYVDSPAWYLIDALPYIKEKVDDNAITLAVAYYVNQLANSIVSENKDCAEKYNKADLSYRALDIFNLLSRMQLGSGAWPWWKGMDGSRHITMEVTKLLLRLKSMGVKDQMADALVNRAMKYLDAEVGKDITQMKKDEKKGIKPSLSHFHLDYLYCQSLADRTKNVAYLMPLVKDATVKADMSIKAKAAVVYARKNRMEDAKEFVESILEHTVVREDVGRYFDSYRTSYSWCDYRIPTQVAAIEAIRLVKGDVKEVKEMQRWILSSKRTQSWDTPLNAVNAVYAFCNGSAKDIKPLGATTTTQTITHKKTNVELKKDSEGESWAAVKVVFKQDLEKVENSTAGLVVKAEMIGDASKVGNKVRVRITAIADRDYDFVTITDNRAACLEPVSQMSGYRNGSYMMIHDTNTEYHFDMFRKGTHVIETEYYVTRTGDYTTGLITAKCTYAPEFTGRGVAYRVKL